MARYDVHIIPHGEQWAVIREGDTTPVSLHLTRDEAERTGRQLAADGDVTLAVHPREGRDDTYHDDPRPDEG